VPKFNELLSVAQRYATGLAAQLGLEEQEGVTTVGPEIMPVLELGEGMPPEMRRWAGERLCGGSISQAAGGAGTFARAVLENPADTAIVAIVEEIWFGMGASASLVDLRTAPNIVSGLVGLQVPTFRDTSLQFGTSAPVCRVRSAADATSPGSTYSTWRKAGDQISVQLRHPIVLRSPGSLIVFVQTANIILEASFLWRERPATRRELQTAL